MQTARIVSEYIAGVGLLILVFLVLSNYKGVAEIIRVLGTYSTKQIKVLQGRG